MCLRYAMYLQVMHTCMLFACAPSHGHLTMCCNIQHAQGFICKILQITYVCRLPHNCWESRAMVAQQQTFAPTGRVDTAGYRSPTTASSGDL